MGTPAGMLQTGPPSGPGYLLGNGVRLVLDRPEIHNAFDDALIASLTEALLRVEADPGVRVVVLAGEGRSFSAGGKSRTPLGWRISDMCRATPAVA